VGYVNSISALRKITSHLIQVVARVENIGANAQRDRLSLLCIRRESELRIPQTGFLTFD
jgi:hypothetical protein